MATEYMLGRPHALAVSRRSETRDNIARERERDRETVGTLEPETADPYAIRKACQLAAGAGMRPRCGPNRCNRVWARRPRCLWQEVVVVASSSVKLLSTRQLIW